MIKQRLLQVCLALFMAAPVFAQNQVTNARLRLLAFSGEMEMPEVYIHDPAGQPDAVPVKYEIKGYLNGEYVTVPLKSRKVAFTTARERASLTTEGQLVAEANLPADSDSSILLFLPGKPGAKAKYQVLAVADSIKAFPAGSFHVTNLSPLPVKLELEKKPFEIKPGQTSLIVDPPAKANSQMGMRAYIFKDEAWKEISSSIWSHPGEARSFMILFPDAESGSIRLRSFDDVKPRKTPAPAVAPASP